MEDTAKKLCSVLFDVLQNKGVRNMVCSPGSRNVPLLLAAASRPIIKKHFVVDERSAGFVGLGISMVKQEPVGLICTSGTALLNYAPAVAEAYYQGLPLIVISADRPLQWIDQDDSQTLRQDNVLENFVKRSYNIPALDDDDPEMQWYVNRVANDAVLEACGGKPGPVHINIHLSEPLGKKVLRKEPNPRVIDTVTGDTIVNKEVIKDLARQLSESKILLVAGFGLPDEYLQKSVSNFSRNRNVVVMAETISNLHLEKEAYCIDSVLTSADETLLDSMAPDIVISIGGAIVSRKLKEYLRRNSHRSKHWSVGYSSVTSDPFMSLTLKIELEPSRFFRAINMMMRKNHMPEDVSLFKERWNNLRREALKVKNEYIDSSGWSELKAFEILLKRLPQEYNLSLSNGTAIRYAQIINYPLPHASYCNRGVSGIDGSVSTAIGTAIAYPGKSILITGDLSMSYDVGALGLRGIPEGFKIIVIDNQGGGIFRFIPSTSSLEEREEYLCQVPLLPLQSLAEGFQWNYYEVFGEESLKEIYPRFLSDTRKSILKVSCNGIESAEILKNYMKIKI